MPGKSKKVEAQRRLFEAEARPHLDTLYAMALRLTRSPVDAEDLVQDTLVRAYRFYDRFEAGTNFKAVQVLAPNRMPMARRAGNTGGYLV